MTDIKTQAQEFIELLAEAGLLDERIDYYVDKLAEGTFDIAELENELNARTSELGDLVNEGEALAAEMEEDAAISEAEIPPKMNELAEDYKAEMAATMISTKAEADDMEKRLHTAAETQARKGEAGSIEKIRKFLKNKK